MEQIKVISATPLSDMRLLVVFSNQAVKLFDAKRIVAEFPKYADLENEDLFSLVKVEPGGYGVSWMPVLDVSEGELWENGLELPLRAEDLTVFIRNNIINTAEVAGILQCSRQNIDDLVKRKKLKPLKSFPRGNVFLKSDVICRLETDAI